MKVLRSIIILIQIISFSYNFFYRMQNIDVIQYNINYTYIFIERNKKKAQINF